MTPYRRELQAARAKLRALQKQHGGLLQDRDLLQAKLRVLPVALQSADEAQRWLVFARATFSRHSRQVLHQQDRLQASFLSLPPPSEWSAPWLQHFSSLPPEAHRFYCCTLGMHIKLVMVQQQQQHSAQVETRILELMDISQALSGVLMRLNPLAVMSNMNRHLHTGQPAELDAWCRQVAASVPVHLLKPGAVPKLRSAFLVYKSSMSRLQATRADLQSQLDSLLVRRQWRALHKEGPRVSEQGSCCHPSGGSSAASWNEEEVQSASVVTDAQLVPLAGTHTEEASTSQSSIVLGDSLSGLHEVLSKLQLQFVLEMRERLTLGRYACTEVSSPMMMAHINVAMYPYLVEFPRVAAHFLDLCDVCPRMQARLAMAAPMALQEV